MKVIYLHQYFNTPSSPGGTRSYEMARRLVNAGHEVHMVTSDTKTGPGLTPPDAGWRETIEDGIHVHWRHVPYDNKMGTVQRTLAFFKFAWQANRKATQLPGDVVFASSTPLTIALPAVRTARKKSVPMVFEVRDLWPEMPIAVGAIKSKITIAAARWLERYAYQNSEQIVALSPGMKAGVVRTGYPEDRVTVIPNSCDPQLFRVSPEVGQEFRSRYSWLQDRPLVVYTGTLGKLNNVSYLARLAAVVDKRDPDVRFLVVGTGKNEDAVRSTAQKLGVLDRNFFMLPPVPKLEMPAILSAADIATSLFLGMKEMRNNSANKLFDALAAGRPVAINHLGWFSEMIRRTGCGLVLDQNDFESAADNLVASIRNERWLTSSRAAARRIAENEFDRDILYAKLESVLLEAVYGRAQKSLEPIKLAG